MQNYTKTVNSSYEMSDFKTCQRHFGEANFYPNKAQTLDLIDIVVREVRCKPETAKALLDSGQVGVFGDVEMPIVSKLEWEQDGELVTKSVFITPGGYAIGYKFKGPEFDYWQFKCLSGVFARWDKGTLIPWTDGPKYLSTKGSPAVGVFCTTAQGRKQGVKLLTEGAKKAIVASEHGYDVVAIPGVTMIASVSDVAEGKEISDVISSEFVGRHFSLAFDSDMAEKPAVAIAGSKICKTIKFTEGVKSVSGLFWDKQNKGLDDALLAGASVEICPLYVGDKQDQVLVRDFLQTGVGLQSYEALLDAMGIKYRAIVKKLKPANRKELLEVEEVKCKDVCYVESADAFARIRSGTGQWDDSLGSKQQALENLISKGRSVDEVEEIFAKKQYARAFSIDRIPGAELIVEADGEKWVNVWSEPLIHPEFSEKGCPSVDKLIIGLCGFNQTSATFIRKWCFRKIKHPGLLAGSALVFIGPQGCGKSMLGEEVMAPLLGGNNVYRADKQNLSTNFAARQMTSLLVLADEITTGEGKRDMSERLKNWISRPSNTCEEKYQKAFEVRNRTGWILTSNHPDPVVVEENDRRFSIFRAVYSTTELMARRKELQKCFTSGINGSPRTKEFDKELAHFAWLAHQETDFQEIERCAVTEEKTALEEANREAWIGFFGLLSIELNKTVEEFNQLADTKNGVLWNDAYQAYRNFCVSQGEKFVLPQKILASRLASIGWAIDRKMVAGVQNRYLTKK